MIDEKYDIYQDIDVKNPFNKIKKRFVEFYRDVPNLSFDLNKISSNFITGSKWIANPYLYALFDLFLINQKIEVENEPKYSDQK